MNNISAIILARNEEDNILEALDTVSFAKEIIVIDDTSHDHTAQLAQKKGAQVIRRELKGDFARQRNFALKQARHDWVLMLDADERIPPLLKREILSLPDNSEAAAYLMRRIDFFWNTKMLHGETGSTYVPRLVHRTRGQFVRAVHETWHSNGQVKKLHSQLHHFPHPTIIDFLRHVNFYSTLNAELYYSDKVRTNAFDIIFRPILKFIYTYFIKFGYLDGPSGFVYSFMMSFHSFLTRSKLYLLQNK